MIEVRSMEYDLRQFEGKHYQPLIRDDRFWATEDAKFLLGGSERLGLDRAKVILDGLDDRKGTLLDIGCNIGFMTFMAQNRGHQATGIDNDIHQRVRQYTELSSIGTAKKLCDVYGLRPEFISGDYLKEIEGRTWDHVLILNVWHHHLTGYHLTDFQRLGVSGAEGVLKKIWAAARQTLHFEIDGYIEPIVAAGWGNEVVAANLERVCGVKPKAIYVSPDAWSHPRTVWRLDKGASS